MVDAALGADTLPGPPPLPGPPGSSSSSSSAPAGANGSAAQYGAPGMQGAHADVDAAAREAVMHEQENAARDVFAASNKRPLDSGPAQPDAKVHAPGIPWGCSFRPAEDPGIPLIVPLHLY